MASTTIERPLPLSPQTEELLRQFFAHTPTHICVVCRRPAHTPCDGNEILENECDAWMCDEHTITVEGWCTLTTNYCPACYKGAKR